MIGGPGPGVVVGMAITLCGVLAVSLENTAGGDDAKDSAGKVVCSPHD